MDTLKYVKVLEAAVHKMAEQLTTDYHGVPWVVNHYIKEGINDVEGRKNMKVMISQPMNGVPDEEVKKIQQDLKEKFAKLHIEVIDSFITDEIKDSNHPGVYYLGRTLMNFMHDIDAVYFVEGWNKARGCRIERHICEEYGIKILDWKFFQDPRDYEETHIKHSFDGVRIMPCKSEPQKEQYQITCSEENHIPRID